jgi:hypothetical protein
VKRLSLFSITAMLLMILVLVGCGAASGASNAASVPTVPSISPTPLAPAATPLGEGPVVIKQIDTLYVGATIYGHGENAVILAGRGGASQYEWSSFAGKLAGAGYTVLSIASLQSEFISVEYERYAIEFLRAHGVKKIVCMGDSMGASGCAFNAHEPELRGLVLLTYHGSADLTDITYPKIFIASEKGGYQNTTTTGYQAAADPKTLVIIPDSTDVSPSLVDSPGVDLHKQILDMLKNVFDQ